MDFGVTDSSSVHGKAIITKKEHLIHKGPGQRQSPFSLELLAPPGPVSFASGEVTMEGIPRFYGIHDSNLDPAELWDSENFPRTFTVALVNRMGDLGLPVNLIRRGTDACFVDGIDVGELYGCPVNQIPRLRFEFDTVYGPFAEIASGVPESSLVVADQRGIPLRRLDVQTSVIPDASTAGLPDDLSGAEVTVRTPTLVNCALSMASSKPFTATASVRAIRTVSGFSFA